MRGCGADGVATVRAPVCVGVALLLSLTGCSAGTGPTSGAAQPSPQEQATAEVPVDLPSLSAVAVYGRHAEARGKVDVRMRNAGSGDVEVETWQLRHPMVESVPAVTRRSRLPGGGTSWCGRCRSAPRAAPSSTPPGRRSSSGCRSCSTARAWCRRRISPPACGVVP